MLGDPLLFAQQGAAGRFRRVRREHRLDAQAGEQLENLAQSEARALQGGERVLDTSRLRPLTFPQEILAAAAHAMHLLREVDRLEPGGEGPHEIARQCRRTVTDARAELGARLLVAFAAANGGHAVELDQLEQLLAALLAQYLADQRAQRVDVVAQSRMLGGELDVAAIHDKRPAFYPIGPDQPASRMDSVRSSSSGWP